MIRQLRPLGLIALAAFSTGSAFGAANELPVSRTAGVVTVNLPAAQTTLMALPLVEIIASGEVTAVSGSNLTLSSTPASLPDLLTNPHAIKITSRSNQLSGSTNAYGLSARITAKTGQQVTVALSTAPNVGDEYVIYRLETIGSIFGAANSAGLTGGGSAGSADLVYIENGGTFTAYFYKNTSGFGTTSGWKLASGGDANQDGVVVPPGRGLLVVRKAGLPVSITCSGDALPANEKSSIVAGFNLVNNPFTVPTTLAGSFLKDYITGGGSAGSADLVYVENGGILTAYFYKNTSGFGTTTGWKLASGGDADQGSVALSPGKSILFREQAGVAEFTLPEPFAE